MPKAAVGATLASMVDDFSDDEFARDGDALLTPDSANENRVPGRKTKGKAVAVATKNAAKAPKARAVNRRASGASVLGPKKSAVEKKKPAAKRAVLAEKQANASDTEEVDEFDDEMANNEPSVTAPAKNVKPAKKGRPAKAKVVEESIVEIAVPEKKARGRPAGAAATKKAGKTTRRKASPAPVEIPETQAEPEEMDIEPSIEVDEVSEQPIQPRVPQRGARQGSLQPIASGRSRTTATGLHRRAGSASDTESRASDPMLRRKLGEMTKKFENRDLKYRNLRELATSDKESTFEKLKRTTDKRDQDQRNLIASLKKELEDQKAIASESKVLQSQVEDLTSEISNLTTQHKTLTKSLTDSQNEVKSLTAKLAASRAQSTEPSSHPSKAPPSSAVKQRTAQPTTAETLTPLQTSQLKEDLYSDLTGLLIRRIIPSPTSTTYDCIQTGVNGTLHFHLAIANNTDEAYEDVEFEYTPFLDEQRDKELMELLPDYLMEEICFPRGAAGKFYGKLGERVTRRVVVVEDEE